MKKKSFLFSTIITTIIFGASLVLLGIKLEIISIILIINLLLVFTFQALSKQSMKNHKYLMKLGMSLFKKRKYKQALELLESAVSKEKSPPADVYKMIGDIYFNGWEVEKNWDKARASYKEILVLDSAVNMSIEFYMQKKDGDSRQLGSHLWALSGPVAKNMAEIAQNNDGEACVILAHWYIFQDKAHKNINKAIEYYRKAIELGQQDCRKHLGFALLEKESASLDEINEGIRYLQASYNKKEIDAGLELWKYYTRLGLDDPAMWASSIGLLADLLKQPSALQVNSSDDNSIAAEIVLFCKKHNCLDKLSRQHIDILQQMAPQSMKL